MQKLTFLLFMFYFGFINAKAQSVERIVFEGLTKTDPQYLSALIDTKTGSLYDSLTVTKDVQYLKNLNLFFSVDYEKKIIESGNYEIIFLIEEAVYLYPILVVSGFKDQLKLQIGCNQINF